MQILTACNEILDYAALSEVEVVSIACRKVPSLGIRLLVKCFLTLFVVIELYISARKMRIGEYGDSLAPLHFALTLGSGLLMYSSLSANTAEIVALINYLREVVDERMHLEFFVRSISV